MDLLTCNLPGIKKLRSGKVREIFEVPHHDDQLLVVTTDRISAFDCILPNAIPGKGKVLNQLSAFWFQNLFSQSTEGRPATGIPCFSSASATLKTGSHKLTSISNHLITTDVEKYPSELQPYAEQLQGRSMIVKKTNPLPIECVVRGYLAGSGWSEYQLAGTLAGVPLPTGLRQAEKLPEVCFTPSTKAEEGHDEPISWKQCKKILGDSVAEEVRNMSIALYEQGRDYAATRGIIIADTKFEFGLLDDKIILIDECMTPDSSRFWPMDQYIVGENPLSFDKQFLRDYLEQCGWNKMPPAPELPDDVVAKTAEKYKEALNRLAT